MEARRLRRRYDHRLQRLVHDTGDVQLAVRSGVPRSTARDWARLAAPEVVTLDVAAMSEDALRREVVRLRRRNAKLLAVLRLVFALIRVTETTLARRRIADGDKKHRILRAVERSRKTLLLRLAFRVIGLSSSRYHSWKRDEECELEDVSSCPQSRPQQLTTTERETVKDMVHSKEYRHVPTGTLAILAQRLGRVFASPSTWHRLVRRHRWRRPRRRLHPAKPRLGVRASAPNEIWHVDTSAVRLLNGGRAYLYAVIDNFSRKILAWRVSETSDPSNTVAILVEAGRPEPTPTLFADGGVENRTAAVEELIDSGVLRRVLAQTEIALSNSLIESWWRTLKHQWLYLNELDTVESLRRLVEFYVDEHTSRLPHSAFQGQTPDEIYRGTGDHIPDELRAWRKAARAARLTTNRALSCAVCVEVAS